MNNSEYLPNESGPPCDLGCEKGLLSCLMQAPGEALPEAVPLVRTDRVFYDLRNRHIYQAIVGLDQARMPVDQLTVKSRLEEAGVFEDIGLAYLGEVIDSAPSASGVLGYARIVRHKFLLREAARIAQGILSSVEEGVTMDDATGILEKAELAVLELNEQRADRKERQIGDLMAEVQDTLDGYARGRGINRGLTTGFEYLDKMICGLGPADLIVLAGRPGMGKTSLAMNIVEHVAIEKEIPAAVFSLEMTNEQLASRLLFQTARADFQRYRTGYLENDDIPLLAATMAQLRNKPLFVDDTAGLNIGELRGRARRMHRQHGIRLIVIDYLQLLRASQRYNNREQEVAEISGALKALAKELKLPVIVLAQLNRDAEKGSRRPALSDLRESGAIEQDADMVGILYKPKEKAEDKGSDWSKHSLRVSLLIAKQRNGPTGDVELLFRKSCMRFSSHIFSRQEEENED